MENLKKVNDVPLSSELRKSSLDSKNTNMQGNMLAHLPFSSNGKRQTTSLLNPISPHFI